MTHRDTASSQGTAGTVEDSPQLLATLLAGSLVGDRMVLRVACLSAEPLVVPGSARLSGQFLDISRRDLLLQRVGRPPETEALPGMAGRQHRPGQGRQRWASRCLAGIASLRNSAGRGGCFGRLSAGNSIVRRKPGAGQL